MTNLVWLRRDLRLSDNPALHFACESATAGVIALYLLTPDTWQDHDDAQLKIAFWLENLIDLSEQLALLNIPLLVIESSATTLAKDILNTMQQHNCQKLFFNCDSGPNERQHETTVESLCNKHDLAVKKYYGNLLFSPQTILKSDDTAYTVFTPYKKKCLEYLSHTELNAYPRPKPQKLLDLTMPNVVQQIKKYRIDLDVKRWPIGEAAARKRLNYFCENKIKNYHADRDYPSVTGTSRLSAYLTAGVISPKQCLSAAMAMRTSQGRETWISEILWREFYQQILFHFPRVGKHRAFKLGTEKLQWHNNPAHFKAWCQGNTGVPIVDAAMRQLNKTGWMHNRLRMICAMFLSKNLFLDWRLGEQYFMQHLIDGDLAANNGGWQWSASTGTDAAPYFRIFNPYRQSERFDPKGRFIKHYCPELASLGEKEIHCPPEIKDYPVPIVDVSATRQFAIAQFKQLDQK